MLPWGRLDWRSQPAVCPSSAPRLVEQPSLSIAFPSFSNRENTQAGSFSGYLDKLFSSCNSGYSSVHLKLIAEAAQAKL